MLTIIYLFITGLAFGSFALAMVDRMKVGKDWVSERSECEFCHHKLHAIDLVPVFSWVINKGKCRYCSKKLSVSYPMSELATGLAFVLSYVFFPYELIGWGIVLLVLWLLAFVILGALFIFDLRWFRLPNKLVYPLVVVGLTYRAIFVLTSSNSASGLVLATAGSVGVAAGLFYVLHTLSKGKWIGDGDVRLGVAMGLFLNGPVEAWLAIFVASTLGLIVALPQIKKNKKGLKMKIPFGPVLIAGLFLTYLFGDSLIDWYSTTFLYL